VLLLLLLLLLLVLLLVLLLLLVVVVVVVTTTTTTKSVCRKTFRYASASGHEVRQTNDLFRPYCFNYIAVSLTVVQVFFFFR
jgi:hypothetical protein